MRQLLGLTLVLGVVCALPAADWPQFLGPTRDAHSTETGLLRAFSEKGPPVLWEMEVGEGYSSPVIAGDRLLVLHRVGNEDLLDCVEAATGKKRWTFRVATSYRDPLGKGDGPRSTPVIDGKAVYCLCADGRLFCIDLVTGKEVWKRALHDDYAVPGSFFGVGTSPLIEGDLLVVNVGARGAGIVALNKMSGKEVWKATDDGASYASPVTAALGGKRQLVFFTRQGLVILDPRDGTERHRQRWRARINASVNAASPVVVGEEIFLSACYDTGAIVLKVTRDKLQEVWSNDESLSCHFSTSVHHNGFLYGFDGRQEQGTHFRCVEWKTGKVRWSKDGFGCGSLVLADNQLIVLSEEGELVLVELSEKGYRETARAAVLKGTCRAHLALANGRLYARSGTRLVCWDFKKK